jgi:hypothetical protein
MSRISLRVERTSPTCEAGPVQFCVTRIQDAVQTVVEDILLAEDYGLQDFDVAFKIKVRRVEDE